MQFQRTTLYKIFIGVFLVLQNFTLAEAADIESTIELDKSTNIVRVEGRFTADSRISNKKNLGFLAAASGISGLGKRVSELKLFGASGKPVAFRKLLDGEYLADSEFASWEYTVDLSANSNSIVAAHVSWLTDENGILMLDDLLPQFVAGKESVSASVTLSNRADWSAASGAEATGKSPLLLNDYRKGVIYVGKEIRNHQAVIKGRSVNLTFSGNWHFTDQEATAMTEQVIAKLAATFGSISDGGIRIGIFKFPIQVNPGSWEAETRGNSVTIISSDMPFRSQSLQRLHEQLRHELFHLWMPNGMLLTGNYAWFYEGFALYNSLKMAVELKRITFDDMLDTLSRAYQIDVRQKPRRPLVETSSNFVGRADTATYARGMLIAFLLDVELMRTSNGRSNIASMLGKIYSANRTIADGNTFVLNAIGENSVMSKYVKGVETIDTADIATQSGLVFENSDGFKILAKPNGRQREILSNLSYNTWRSSNRIKK